MEPSKEAIETVYKVWIQTWQEWWNHGNPDWRAGRPEAATKSMIGSFLLAAYDIDFAALQQEYEDLLVDRNKLLGQFPALQQENARLKEENERLRSEEVRDKQIYALIARCSDWSIPQISSSIVESEAAPEITAEEG